MALHKVSAADGARLCPCCRCPGGRGRGDR
jgi:hypothetical protein